MNSIVVSGERSQGPTTSGPQPPEAIEFVRYCYRRRRVQWPEIYDEMCAVASRGDFNGWGFEELAEHGIRFTIEQLPGLTALVEKVVQEDGRDVGSPGRHASDGKQPRRTSSDDAGWPAGRVRAGAG